MLLSSSSYHHRKLSLHSIIKSLEPLIVNIFFNKINGLKEYHKISFSGENTHQSVDSMHKKSNTGKCHACILLLLLLITNEK